MDSHPKLLVVDDDAEIREQLKWALSSEYVVLQAENRPTALAVTKREHPSLVLLDLGLPPCPNDATEGLAALEEFLGVDRLPKVIVITGNSDRTNALQAVQMGAYDYIQKPIQVDILRVILRRAVYLHCVGQEHREIEEQRGTGEFEDMLGVSSAMQRVFTMIRRVAASDVPVLITGESGTGKGLIARAIHRHSLRKAGPFIAINCGAIPENLLESELFGHEKGAFTGAHVQRKGRIELAQGGTLFLDEIGELSLALQVKLLHVLEEQRIDRIGGREEITVDARVIAATNRDLGKGIQDGGFREDLFYRLQVVTICVPPLRDRREDIKALAQAMVQEFARQFKKHVTGFNRQALKALVDYDWPGNVRELENRIKRAVVMAEGPRITPEDLELTAHVTMSETLTLREVRESIEKDIIQRALVSQNGNISRAAQELAVSRPTLYDMMKKYGLEKPQ